MTSKTRFAHGGEHVAGEVSLDLIGSYLMTALPFLLVALLATIAVLAVRADSGGRTPPSFSKRMTRLEDGVGVLKSRKRR